MRKIILILFSLGISIMLYANTKTEKIFESKNSELQGIILNKPNLKRGIPIMQALEKRQSTRQFSSKELSLQDISDLLWHKSS